MYKFSLLFVLIFVVVVVVVLVVVVVIEFAAYLVELQSKRKPAKHPIGNLTNGSREMGASGSMERKPAALKTKSPCVATSADQPHSNGKLSVISPPTTASTPSTPSHDASIRRNRSHSSDGGWPTTEKPGNSGGDVDNDVNGGGGGSESVGFSLAELAHYCNRDDSEENQLQDGGDRPTSGASNKTHLQVCGVKPPVVEQQTQKAESAHSTAESTRSDSSSDTQQPRQRLGSGAATHGKTKPKLSEGVKRRSCEAITDITQAKTLSHRAVVARLQKTSNPAGAGKVAGQRRQNDAAATSSSPRGTATDNLSKGCRPASSKSVQGAKSVERSEREKRESEGTPSQAAPEPPKPEMKVIVRSKAASGAAPPAGNEKQKSAQTTSKKRGSSNAKPPQPVVTAAAAADDDDDDDDDWMNQITSLRDPDDIRNRKVEPRRGSNINSWGQPQKLPLKPAKDEKGEDEEEDEEVNNACNNNPNPMHQNAIRTHYDVFMYNTCTEIRTCWGRTLERSFLGSKIEPPP